MNCRCIFSFFYWDIFDHRLLEIYVDSLFLHNQAFFFFSFFQNKEYFVAYISCYEASINIIPRMGEA